MDLGELRVALRDGDGYPTEAGLSAVRTFTGSARELVELLYEGMRAYGVVTIEPKGEGHRKVVEVYLATGGWSGNESIVDALRDSFFWFVYWHQSGRGGAFWFRVPVDSWDKPMPDWPPAQQHGHEHVWVKAHVVEAPEDQQQAIGSYYALCGICGQGKGADQRR